MAVPAHVYAVPLPIFDEKEHIGAALDSPGVIASGALVSKEGDRYWVHNVEELMAMRGKRQETLHDVRAHGRELKRVDLGEQKSAGIRLVKPKSGETHNALRDIFSDIGLKTPSLRTFKDIGLVFSYADNAYVAVGTSYHCSKYNEVYDQADFDRNDGECPLHEGAKLIRN